MPYKYFNFVRYDSEGNRKHTDGIDKILVPSVILTGKMIMRRYVAESDFEILGEPELTGVERKKYVTCSPRIISSASKRDNRLFVKDISDKLVYNPIKITEPILVVEPSDYVISVASARTYASRADVVENQATFNQYLKDGLIDCFRKGEGFNVGAECVRRNVPGVRTNKNLCLFLLSEINGLKKSEG